MRHRLIRSGDQEFLTPEDERLCSMLVANQLAGFGAGGGPSDYKTGAVAFDGVNDYLNRGGNLTGEANDGQGIVSFWFNLQGGDGNTQSFYNDRPSGDVRFIRNSSNRCYYDVGTTTGGNQWDSPSPFTAGSGWHHFLGAFDFPAGPIRQIYIDGVDEWDGATANPTGLVQYASLNTDVGIGAQHDGNYKLNGFLADFYFNQAEYLDISVAANRLKFRGATGKPVNLGSDGSLPTGTAPIVFLRLVPGQAASTFATNKGTGGGFTENGALTAASSSPTD